MVNAATVHQVLRHPIEHDIGHLRVANQLITVIAIFIMLMQVNIVQTGPAVQDAVINDKAFEMQDAKRFTGVNRNAIDRNIDTRVFLRHSAIPVSIGIGCRSPNTTALGSVPVDKHPDIQFRTLPFCRIESVKYAFTTVILFQVQRNNADPSRRAGYFFQQSLPEISGSIKEIYIIN